MSEQLCVHAVIHGRVQGVGYRAWADRKAHEKKLTGWVKNLPDGQVELLVCGDATQVESMLTECERGPIAADVLRIERKMPDIPPPIDFKQLATG